MKHMKYVIALFLALVGFGSTFARAQDLSVSTIPFDFVVGNKTLPAGKYSISQALNSAQGGPLLIRSAGGKDSAFFNPTTSESTTQNDTIKLVFLHEGDKYFLTEIVGASETFTVTPSVQHQRTLDPEATVSISTP